MFKKPYIILKFAQSKDNFIGQEGKSIWLSNEFSKRLVHKWRSEVDAILVGTGTVLSDNPKLTTRFGFGKNPTRIVLDRQLNLGVESFILNNVAKTIIFTKKNNKSPIFKQQNKYIVAKPWDLVNINSILYSEGIRSIIIEGGAKVLKSYVEQDLWDEARIFTADKSLKFGLKAPELNCKPIKELRILNDKLQIFRNPKSIS